MGKESRIFSAMTLPAAWVLVIGRPDLLGALPGDLDFEVAFVGRPRCSEQVVLAVGEVLLAGAQDVGSSNLTGQAGSAW